MLPYTIQYVIIVRSCNCC